MMILESYSALIHQKDKMLKALEKGETHFMTGFEVVTN